MFKSQLGSMMTKQSLLHSQNSGDLVDVTEDWHGQLFLFLLFYNGLVQLVELGEIN